MKTVDEGDNEEQHKAAMTNPMEGFKGVAANKQRSHTHGDYDDDEE